MSPMEELKRYARTVKRKKKKKKKGTVDEEKKRETFRCATRGNVVRIKRLNRQRTREGLLFVSRFPWVGLKDGRETLSSQAFSFFLNVSHVESSPNVRNRVREGGPFGRKNERDKIAQPLR